MTVQQQPTQGEIDRERAEWLAWVDRIVSDVAAWSDERGWAIHRDVKTIEEDEWLGTYEVPFLRVRTPQGQIHVDPIARYIFGDYTGRVDLEGWPLTYRMRLARTDTGIEIINDENDILPDPWNRETFFKLVKELTLR